MGYETAPFRVHILCSPMLGSTPHKPCRGHLTSEGRSFTAGRQVHTLNLIPSLLASHTFSQVHTDAPHRHTHLHTPRPGICVLKSPHSHTSGIALLYSHTCVCTHTYHKHTYHKGTSQATHADPAFSGGPRKKRDLLLPTAKGARLEHLKRWFRGLKRHFSCIWLRDLKFNQQSTPNVLPQHALALAPEVGGSLKRGQQAERAQLRVTLFFISRCWQWIPGASGRLEG